MLNNTHASYDTDLIQFGLADRSEIRAPVRGRSAPLASPDTSRLRDTCLHIGTALFLVGLMAAGIALRVWVFLPH